MFKNCLFLCLLLLSHATQTHIIINMTIPKCGTGLINNVIKKITNIKKGTYISPPLSDNYFSDKNFLLNKFYSGHIWPTEKILNFFSKSRFKGFLLIRDPRDQVLSAIDYIKKGGLKDWFSARTSYNEIFRQLITNPRNKKNNLFFYTSCITVNLGERYEIFINSYGQLPNFCMIRFEELVGPQGGGSYALQYATIKKMTDHIGLKLSDAEIKKIMNDLFGGSITFNKGKIGRWKTEFTPKMKELFKQHFSSEYLIELGYETSLDW